MKAGSSETWDRAALNAFVVESAIEWHGGIELHLDTGTVFLQVSGDCDLKVIAPVASQEWTSISAVDKHHDLWCAAIRRDVGIGSRVPVGVEENALRS